MSCGGKQERPLDGEGWGKGRCPADRTTVPFQNPNCETLYSESIRNYKSVQTPNDGAIPPTAHRVPQKSQSWMSSNPFWQRGLQMMDFELLMQLSNQKDIIFTNVGAHQRLTRRNHSHEGAIVYAAAGGSGMPIVEPFFPGGFIYFPQPQT